MPEMNHFSALRMGDCLGPVESGPVTRAALAQMAAVLQDPNPIHLDREHARAKGLPDVIQQAPLTEAIGFCLLHHFFGPHRLQHCRFRLLGNVFPGDRLFYKGEVVRKALRRGEQSLTCSLWVERHDATVVLRGTVDLLLVGSA